MSNEIITSVSSDVKEASVNSTKSVDLDYDYEWILNENLLRDEGALYGLSDTPVKDKIATIYNFYEQKIIQKQVQNEYLGEAKEGLKQVNIELIYKVELLKKQHEDWSSSMSHREHSLPRSLVRMVFYLSIISFSFLMVYEWSGNLWNYSLLATLGTYMMGALGFFNNHSIIYQRDSEQIPVQRELWKVIIEEYMIPFVVTLFIVAWQAKSANLFQIITFALFLYFLFVWAGRGFLTNILAIRNDYVVRKNNLLANQYRLKKIQDTSQELDKLAEDIKSNLEKIEQLDVTMANNTKDKAALKAEAEAKVAYFKSEFHLAQQARAIITNEQRVLIGLPLSKK